MYDTLIMRSLTKSQKSLNCLQKLFVATGGANTCRLSGIKSSFYYFFIFLL